MKAIDSTTTHATAIQRKSNAGPFFQPEESREGFFGSTESPAPFFNPAPPTGNNPASATIQAKLTVGAPNDVYEQEADAMADKVVQRLAIGSVQRKCAACAKDDAEKGIAPKLQKKSIFESNEEPANGQVQRKCKACTAETIQPKRIQRAGEEEEAEVQAKSLQGKRIQRASEEEETELQEKPIQLKRIQPMGGEEEEPALQAKGSVPGLQASSDLESRLNTTKGSGNPLPDNTRSSMESSFGADFSNVRVHTNNSAVQMNQELGAQAFTHGSDIYFNSGKYDTGSSDGQRLLAHELTHTVQQGEAKESIDKKIDFLSNSNEFQSGNYLDKTNLKQNTPVLQRQGGGARRARPTDLIQILTNWVPDASQYGFQLKFRCRSTSGDVEDLQNQAPNLIWRELVTYSRNDFAHRIAPNNPTILPAGGVSFAAANTGIVGKNLLEFTGITDTHWMPADAVRSEDFDAGTGRTLPAVMESRQVYQYSPDGGTTWRYFAGAFIIRRTFFRTAAGMLRFRTSKIGIHSTTEDHKP